MDKKIRENANKLLSLLSLETTDEGKLEPIISPYSKIPLPSQEDKKELKEKTKFTPDRPKNFRGRMLRDIVESGF